MKRPACFILEACKGYRNQARSLILRAAHQAGLTGHWMGSREAHSYNLTEARFLVDCTDKEFEVLMARANQLSLIEGWERLPFDVYHD